MAQDRTEEPLTRETILAAGLGCALMLMSARLVWLHYFVLLVPLVLLGLSPDDAAMDRRAGGWRRGVAAVALLLQTPMYFTLHLDAILGKATPHALASVVLTAMGALLLRDLRRDEKAAA